jgi:site-specific DNA recombinase
LAEFAFYGRVSTEDLQDPASSRGWQLSRSRGLIAPHGGVIVAEYFDVGLSRSLPWKRRPQAAALLADLKRSDRGFDSVVIGEPARAFYGNQFGLTFPVFVHYGVQLWVPEVGGAVDPGSDAHDLVMSLYGGMSKGERNRIKIRVRTAMASQASTEGRFLGGRPPYGYQLVDAGPHPNPGKAAIGQRLHRLETDPVAAPVVLRIFADYLAGKGIYAIAERLTADGIPCPSAHDPERNRHRSGVAWSKGAVRAILLNPRYTGRQVWNKQRRDEVLLDVEDVAAGHETRMRWNPAGEWIWSSEIVQEPVISPQMFQDAQTLLATRGRRLVDRKIRPAARPYALRGLLLCGICSRKMQGHWVNDRAHYRCRYPSEYAETKELAHPRNVYLREVLVVPELDRWLASLFTPKQLPLTIKALAEAQEIDVDPGRAAMLEAASRTLAACDQRLAKYRAGLEAGMEPALVAQWTAEVRAQRLRAEHQLQPLSDEGRLTEAEIAELVGSIRDVVKTLKRADPETKADVYRELGLKMIYTPAERRVLIEASPHIGVQTCPRGDLNPHSP